MSDPINLNTPEISEISMGEYRSIYGINLWSRYGYDEEVKEMLEFVRLIAKADLQDYIIKIYYDSKASLCFIETSLDDFFETKGFEIDQKDFLAADAIRTIALLTITQFQLFNDPVGHQNFILRKLFNI